jgi:predicted PurR-regulated permease PerM
VVAACPAPASNQHSNLHIHVCCCSHRRRLLVVIYFAIIIAFITLFGVMTIPDIVREGADFIRRLKSDNVWVILVEKMRHGLG